MHLMRLKPLTVLPFFLTYIQNSIKNLKSPKQVFKYQIQVSKCPRKVKVYKEAKCPRKVILMIPIVQVFKRSIQVSKRSLSVQEMSYFKRSIQVFKRSIEVSKSKCPKEVHVSKRAKVAAEGEEGGEGGRGGQWWLGLVRQWR